MTLPSMILPEGVERRKLNHGLLDLHGFQTQKADSPVTCQHLPPSVPIRAIRGLFCPSKKNDSAIHDFAKTKGRVSKRRGLNCRLIRFPLDAKAAIAKESHMHRTTILLPDDLYKSAGKEARSLGVSLGELIRRRLASSQQHTESKQPFFSRQPWTQELPRDLSVNHDKYLYES